MLSEELKWYISLDKISNIMQKILVPVDFSENSINALRYAVEIARLNQGEVTVFNSYPIDVPMGMEYSSGIYMQTLNSEVKEDREKRLREIISEYAKKFYYNTNDRVKINYRVREGVPSISIIELSEEESFSLVVMGTQGASGLEEVLLGSITSSIITNIKLPVLAIPERATFKSIDHIVYASDFAPEDCFVLEDLQSFADLFGAKITCLHINTKESDYEENQEKMTQLKENFFFTPQSKLSFKMANNKSVEKGLINQLEEEDVDLISIFPQDRGFIESLFHSSITKKMAFHSKTPLLVLRK